ncbi:MAG: serine hydrolase [Candidatus Devosia phytovorans]|uniref:Serine hydrolase n=1 Tax=Candidatus Devosia phytovorans TaxID=3121372 RepID=A0AAJ5VWT3_9HYPH|nr:serine hydrolase domain-containing protein [Devosia sp.]WEK06341.1 MAG: serine hydrolase [Devosia sp.]
MSKLVDRVIENAIDNKSIVGTEVIAAIGGEVVYRRSAGYFDREAGTAMPVNAIYRLASVTKPIVATTALAMVDKGMLRLSDLIADYLPYFQPRLGDGSVAKITIAQLLTHTAGLSYRYPDDPSITTGMQDTEFDHAENLTRIANQPLLFAPGGGWTYSVATDVLGAVLAAIGGGSLGEAARRHVTGPLGMGDTGFEVSDLTRLAPPYADGVPEPTRMLDHQTIVTETGDTTVFSPVRLFNAKAFQSGGAGMVGTGSDILKLLEALRTGGGGVLSPALVAAAMSNQIGDLPRDDAGLRFGYLGAVVDDPAAANTPESRGSVNWGGVYGHSWLVDPASELIMVSMSNTAQEGCLGMFPRNVRNAIYADFLPRRNAY